MPNSRTTRTWLAAIGGITVAAFAVSGWLSGFRGSNAWSGLFASFVYTFFIGTLATVVCTRTWPWAEGRRPVVLWSVRIGTLLAAVAMGTLLGLLVLWNIGIISGRSFWRTYFFSLQFATFISATFGLTLMIYEYWRAKYEHSELERERALKLATEARLASLASRIHPHFLFNTLNSISSLIHSNPEKADEQLQRLCALLRFSLDSSETPLVPLHQELKIVRDYLDIEKTRFGNRLRFAIEVPDALGNTLVPPLSLQTLVENSVKHVIAPSRQGGEIRLTANRAGASVSISIVDGGPGVPPGPLPAGHGLDNLRARLHVLFGDRARLILEPSSVRLELPA